MSNTTDAFTNLQFIESPCVVTIPIIYWSLHIRTKKAPLFLVLVALFVASFNAAAAVSCAALVAAKLAAQPYSGLKAILTPHLATLK
jgi:phosphoglycerol transferase MdoB-like AlkP superfamily enzyme